MGSLGWAITLSVLSAISYAVAAVAQERLAEHGQRGWSRWALALVLTGSGVVLHVVALHFGTLAVVQTLGTLTLLFALPIQAVRYGTRFGRAARLDAVLTVAGLALILSLSVDSPAPDLLGEPTVRGLSLLTAGVVGVLAVAGWRAGPRLRALLLAIASGIAFGIASVLSKAVLAAYADGRLPMPSIAAVAVFAGGGYLLGQLSYRGAGLAAPLATVSVANPVVAAIAGVVVFDEGFRYSPGSLVVVALAAVVMTWGVIGLARRAVPPPPPGTPAPPVTVRSGPARRPTSRPA